MADVFTAYLTFGPWSYGLMTPTAPGIPYMTIQPSSTTPPTLAALSLDNTTPVQNQAVTISILGATATSVLTVSVGTLPTGLTLNSAARTITGTPTGTGLSSFTLLETLAGAVGNPKSTALGITVQAAIGNLIQPTTWANFLTAYAAAVPGDVISINHGGYTPTTPQTLTINRTIAGAGLTLIGASNQTVNVVANGQANCQTELVNWTISGDSVAGNSTGTGSGNYSVYITGSSKIALRGCTIGQGYFGVVTHNSTDIVVDNCNVFFSRNDIVRWQLGVSRIALTSNYLVDALTAGVFWYKTDGTTPVIAATNPGGYTQQDPDHNDGLQGFQGACNDLTITGNFVQLYGQGFFLANDIGGSQTRVLIDSNTVQVQYYTALLCDTATDVQVSSNTFLVAATPDPGNGTGVNIFIAKAGGTGPVRTGLNSVPASSSVTSPYVLTGAMTGDSVVAPSASTFLQTTSNVGNLTTLRSRPSYTLYAGALVAYGLPTIVGPGGALSAYAVNDWLSLAPGVVKGRTVNSESTYKFQWKVNGTIVQGPTTGLSGAKYQAAAGSVTGEYSVDGGSVWIASTAVTVSAASATWDPAHKEAQITLSGGDLTATADQGFAASNKSVYGTTAKTADGSYEVRLTPTSWQTSSEGVGFTRAALATNIEIGGAANTFGLYNDGTVQIAGAFQSATGARGQNAYRFCLRISGSGTVATVWIYDEVAAAWLSGSGKGGDPNAAGAGWVISSFLGAGGITFAWNGSRGLNESCTVQTTGFAPTSTFSLWA